MDEQALIEAARIDPGGFAPLYEANFHRVYAYLVRRTGDREVAEDLTAEVFREALANLHKFEWRGVPFAAWLMRIAANAVSDHWRKTRREQTEPASEPVGEPSGHEIESTAMLFQLVERLPAAQQRVIEARFVEGKSIREIAEELDRSQGAIKQLQLRAVENLRAAMESKP